MGKEYEKARLKVKREYEDRLKRLAILESECETLRKDNNCLRLENDTLSEENAQLKDWVERLLDYCNLSEKDIQALRDKIDLVDSIHNINSTIENITRYFFR